MTKPPPTDITELLLDWSKGDPAALDKLTPLVYAQLRRLADGYLRRERPDHTLQATALVHEAYIKLVDQTVVDWKNRAQFFGLVAQIMRNILVDHARSHNAEKRGSGERKISLDEAIALPGGSRSELLALDDALKSLAAIDPDKSRRLGWSRKKIGIRSRCTRGSGDGSTNFARRRFKTDSLSKYRSSIVLEQGGFCPSRTFVPRGSAN